MLQQEDGPTQAQLDAEERAKEEDKLYKELMAKMQKDKVDFV